uniref:Glycine-rich peptide n=1 Tax=Scytodes thoracica TaxID=1112478 RepID=A0A0A0VC30_SCYTH|nr:glycine-rich peptide [Scytodes thoracica]
MMWSLTFTLLLIACVIATVIAAPQPFLGMDRMLGGIPIVSDVMNAMGGGGRGGSFGLIPGILK